MRFRRIFATILALCAFALCLPTAFAAEAVQTSNVGKHDYYNWWCWAEPSTSGLSYDAATGVYTRVEYANNAVLVETYSKDWVCTGSRTIPMELSIYGGFHSGKDFYFLIFGQTNHQENDNTEVIRVVKYDKNWKRLGQASLKGANTTVPFDAGSVSTAEYNGYLYIRTSHEMYTSDDGLNHQANLTMNVRIADMVITDSVYDVKNNNYGYVSHSFNQFIAVDETEKKVVAADHGDAYPRAVMVTKYCAQAGKDRFMDPVKVSLGNGSYTWKYAYTMDVHPIMGQFGDNKTGVELGGFAVSDSAYITIGNTVPQENNSVNYYAQRNIFLAVTDKDMSSTEETMLTNYKDSDDVYISNPYLVRIDGNRFLALWMEDRTLRCVFLNGSGDVGQSLSFEVNGDFASGLSDCQPIVADGKVVWYVTSNSQPVFFTIDLKNPSVTETHCLQNGVCRVCGEGDHRCRDKNRNYQCDLCGAAMTNPDPIIRLAGTNRWETSILVADEMKYRQDVEKFPAIIIASGHDFADALAGSYLAAVRRAPILLSWGKGGSYAYLDNENIEYIKANLAEDGTIYILGGKNAVPELYEKAFAGYDVRRLGGANRFETNLLILEEAGVRPGSEILVCTSTNFADSLSASAVGKPILLVFNESGKLDKKQQAFLDGLTICSFTIIGGEKAVSAKLKEALGNYGRTFRLAGANRFETSVMVAERYFYYGSSQSAVLAYGWNYPDGLCGGALASAMDCPLILTMTRYESCAASYTAETKINTGIVLGGEGLISDAAVRTIFQMKDGDQIVK